MRRVTGGNGPPELTWEKIKDLDELIQKMREAPDDAAELTKLIDTYDTTYASMTVTDPDKNALINLAYDVHKYPAQRIKAKRDGKWWDDEERKRFIRGIDEDIKKLTGHLSEGGSDARRELNFAKRVRDELRSGTWQQSVGFGHSIATRMASSKAVALTKAHSALSAPPPLCAVTAASAAAAATTAIVQNMGKSLKPVHVPLHSDKMSELMRDGCNMCEVIRDACDSAFTHPYRVHDAKNDCRRLIVSYNGNGGAPTTVAVFATTPQNLRPGEEVAYCQWVIYHITNAIYLHWAPPPLSGAKAWLKAAVAAAVAAAAAVDIGMVRTIMFDRVGGDKDEGPGGDKSRESLKQRIERANRDDDVKINIDDDDVTCDVGGNKGVITLKDAMKVPKARADVFVTLLTYVLSLHNAEFADGNRRPRALIDRYTTFLQTQVVDPMINATTAAAS